MNNFELVMLEKDTLPLVINIARDVIQNNYSSFLDKSIIDNFINSGQCDREITDNMKNCMVMKKDNTCIGFSILIDNSIHLMMINRNYQRQKYGSTLLHVMETRLFEKYNIIQLQSFSANIVANNFYEKNGWQKIKNTEMGDLMFHQYKKTKNKK
jgi:N-acetylglutamate synthase-like GNAT family acetyltransferase